MKEISEEKATLSEQPLQGNKVNLGVKNPVLITIDQVKKKVILIGDTLECFNTTILSQADTCAEEGSQSSVLFQVNTAYEEEKKELANFYRERLKWEHIHPDNIVVLFDKIEVLRLKCGREKLGDLLIWIDLYNFNRVILESDLSNLSDQINSENPYPFIELVNVVNEKNIDNLISLINHFSWRENSFIRLIDFNFRELMYLINEGLGGEYIKKLIILIEDDYEKVIKLIKFPENLAVLMQSVPSRKFKSLINIDYLYYLLDFLAYKVHKESLEILMSRITVETFSYMLERVNKQEFTSFITPDNVENLIVEIKKDPTALLRSLSKSGTLPKLGWFGWGRKPKIG